MVETKTDTNKDISISVDEPINNNSNELKILNFFCTYSYTIFLISITILFTSFISLLTICILNKNINYIFWINQLSKYLVVILIQFCMSMLVIYKNVKVNYTRKVIHISFFLWPQILDTILIKYKQDLYTDLWNTWIIFYVLVLSSEHVRKRNKFLDNMFKAIDRPEDRPYTLIWFSSQIIATIIVMIPFSIYFKSIDRSGLIFIPILINGLADGLAEPVGVRFGKHKYKTKSCLGSKEYERSYEGSACVFFVSLFILIPYYLYMNMNQYIFSLLLIPLMATLAEAFSPHTWDSPCLFFVVCSLIIISLQI